jgi:hypothetical protein
MLLAKSERDGVIVLAEPHDLDFIVLSSYY